MTAGLMKYFGVDTPLVKAIGPSADGESTVFYVLATPLGSPQKKDLHEDYFMATTHYGDPRMKTLPAFYEHLMNDYNNPYMAKMGVEKMELGISTLLTDEQKKDADLDLAERWADFEVLRSLEYHDMLVNLVDAKLMGMSTQCFPNGKSRQADGGLTRWVENERSMTPTPAASATLGKVIEIYKTYQGSLTSKSATPLLPTLALVKDGQVIEINLDHPETALAEPTPVVELDLAQQLDAILLDEPVIISVDEQVRGVIAEEIEKSLAPMKASISIMMEMWGSTPEAAREQREALMTMLGSLDKSVKQVEGGLLTLAQHMKNQKSNQVVTGAGASDRELQLLNSPTPQGQAKPVKSGVPAGIRERAK